MTTEAMPDRRLRAHLAAGAPAREAFVARLFLACMIGAVIAVFALSPASQRHTILGQIPYFLIPIAYHAVLLVVLRSGRFHPIVPWLDAAVQTSALALPFYFTAQAEGLPFIVSSSMTLGWMSIVAVSALKANPVISIGAGVLGGVEYLAISLSMFGDTLSSVQRAHVLTTAAFFVLSGVVAAGVATYLIRQAQHALHAVRGQDLMSKYFMHERLGAGGMAEVFRATYSPDGGFEKIVAVKRVLPEVADAADGRLLLEMFREEAKLCARLSHPNVVQVLDAGRFDGRYVLTMEYIDGVSLRHVIAGRRLPLAVVAFVAAELAAALDYIHARVDADGTALRLVHRDVNPPNVLISRLGEVKLADFGVAHAVDRASLDPKRVYGKLGYLAPEQLHDVPIDGRADLFALGLTMYEMCLGKPMFRGASMWEVAELRRPELELAAAEIPSELQALIIDLLAIEPDKRPQTGAAVRARLLALAGSAAPFPSGQIELARLVRETPTRELAQPPTAVTVRAT
jgi:eukaryotic-like serine/threonine-protein kinase